TQAFWEAAAQGRFLIRRCAACGKAHWYPRKTCPFCWSEETAWVEASGRGTIYSYSVMRRAAEPYVVAYVTLAEGPTMLTNLVDCDFDALAIGQAVRLKFSPSDDGPPVPTFTIAES
ncbi:MAG TPA: Zn-ribbon domain-containing OB-fold protein, partial [Xanthobacteraceae bacterium]|nr:Zn-ribbon domain-containing OB-fold protein [Xanthobacteraceae bacterium]